MNFHLNSPHKDSYMSSQCWRVGYIVMKIDLLPAEEPTPSRCVCNLNIAEKVSRLLQVVFVYFLPCYRVTTPRVFSSGVYNKSCWSLASATSAHLSLFSALSARSQNIASSKSSYTTLQGVAPWPASSSTNKLWTRLLTFANIALTNPIVWF